MIILLKSKTRKYFSVCFLCLALSISYGCSSSGGRRNTRPLWLTDTNSAYPDSLYMTAIGEGSSRAQAIDHASAVLTRRFEARIQAENIIEEHYNEVVNLAKNEAFAETRSEQSLFINIASSQELYNISYPESYTDDLGRVYVLAYLHRMNTAEVYMNKINENQESITFYLNKFQNTSHTDLLSRYAFLSTALFHSYNNRNLLSQLNIIFPDYSNFINLTYDHNDLTSKLFQTARDIKFSLNISNDTDNAVKDSLRQVLTDMGFSIADSGRLKLSGTTKIEPVDLGRRESFVRWSYSINLVDEKQNIVLSHHNNGREGHINRQEAKARAIRIMRNDIRTNFQQHLFGFFEQMVN